MRDVLEQLEEIIDYSDGDLVLFQFERDVYLLADLALDHSYL